MKKMDRSLKIYFGSEVGLTLLQVMLLVALLGVLVYVATSFFV